MKSNVCNLENGKGIESVFSEVERIAEYCKLDQKKALQLRLLSEEMMGMMSGIIGDYQAEFWIDVKYEEFQLHLWIDMLLGADEKKKLLKLSSTGQNEAERSFMGKLKSLFESCIDNYAETGEYCTQTGIYIPTMNDMYSACSMSSGGMTWSLDQYRNQVSEPSKEKEWDELEKSIVAKLADDIIVSVQKHQAEITVKKIL